MDEKSCWEQAVVKQMALCLWWVGHKLYIFLSFVKIHNFYELIYIYHYY